MKAYRAQGYTESEAFGRALADRAGEVGLDMLGGALSGEVMAGGSIAINAYQNGRLVKEGLKAPEGSEIRKTAEQIRAELNVGQKVSQAEYAKLGQLINANTQLRDILNTELNEQKNTASAGETVNMHTLLNETEKQKAARLLDAEVTVTRAKKGSGNPFNFAKLSKLSATEAESYLRPLLNKLGITKNKYSNTALEVEFEYSKRGAKRSVSHQYDATHGDYTGFSLVQKNLKELCENAYPLEAHYDEKPKASDNHVTGVATLGSVLQAGSRQLPVRLTIKFFDNAEPKLHIVINSEGSAPVRADGTQNAHQPTENTPATMTITDYFKLVNGNEEFTKRIPDSITGKNNGSLLVERDIHAELNNARTSVDSQEGNAAMSPVNSGEGGEKVKLDKRINPGEIERIFLSNLVTPKPGSAAAKNVKFAENEYGIKAYVVKADVWNKYSFPGPITSRNGAIFMTNAITRTDYIQHEATHIMAQDGFEPYLDFLERTPEYVNMYSPKARDLLQKILEHVMRKKGADISELSDNDRLRLHFYDELNATLYGHIANGKTSGYDASGNYLALDEILIDLADYSSRMRALHEEYKRWKRSVKGGVETSAADGYNGEKEARGNGHGGEWEKGSSGIRGYPENVERTKGRSSGSSAEGTGGVYAAARIHSEIPVAGGEARTSSVAAPAAGGEKERDPSTVERYRRKLEDERTKLKVKKLKLAQGRAMRAIELEDEYEKNVRE